MMDSFYDAPRRAPVPTAAGRVPPTPMVPEVSILCNNNSASNNYNAWKARNEAGQSLNNKENIDSQASGYYNSPQSTALFLKKQVRFESPVLQQRPSLTYEPLVKTVPSLSTSTSGPRQQLTEVGNHNFQGKTFEQIYLANIPNRHLDLSTIDTKPISKQLPRNTNLRGPNQCLRESNSQQNADESKQSDKDLPKTYKEFLQTQNEDIGARFAHNDSITDILSYSRAKKSLSPLTSNVNKPSVGNYHNIKTPASESLRPFFCDNTHPPKKPENDVKYLPRSDGVTQTSVVLSAPPEREASVKKAENDSEPTVKDLLKIITQQNEQLLLLQQQVATLINRDQQKQIEAPPAPVLPTNTNYVTSTQHETYRNPSEVTNTPRKRALSKFSIDMMTSFEVSFRPQHNAFQKKDFVNYEPKIQEITETSNSCESKAGNEHGRTVDTSMHFQEPLKVVESCPSPEPSIKINMNDYDSSEEDEEVTTSEIGASFYKNLMGQVNNILKKAQVPTCDNMADGAGSNNKTMHRVKEATLKHLKSIGVSLPQLNESGESLGSSTNDSSGEYSPTEISFAVKQLLLKYLPAEHLAKITCKEAKKNLGAVEMGAGLIASRPEFSFASVQYMKKYNLLSSNNELLNQGGKVARSHKGDNPKILDISKLKNQPKLL